MKRAIPVRMVDLIVAKRAGKEHSSEEINFIIKSLMDGSLPDYQLSAWLMAVCWRGLSMDETATLTQAMAQSGEVLDLSSIGPIVGDKHSTGGVGDKTTLVFVPLLAAVGIPMAKLSGRGLGHTGGTIDKLEAIPGFNTSLPIDQFIAQVKKIGAAIAGQTQQLAPADGKIYAMRDVTGTVESIPLIAASVVSKKVAAGSNLIILDVKCGSGAFMKNEKDASELANTMVEIGKRLKRAVTAVVTDMEQPLGNAVGHTLEVIEAIETLKGKGPDDLMELCLSLGAMALVVEAQASNEEEARAKLRKVLENGEALKKFAELIDAQGGDSRVLQDYSLMPQAKLKIDVIASDKKDQWIKHLNGLLVAEACKLMGAGRTKKDDKIDLAVGVVLHGKIGSKIKAGSPVVTIYAASQADADKAKAKLLEAITYSDFEVPTPGLIKAKTGRISAAPAGAPA
jgi:pyrimidine-nucleoside phosphorylase